MSQQARATESSELHVKLTYQSLSLESGMKASTAQSRARRREPCQSSSLSEHLTRNKTIKELARFAESSTLGVLTCLDDGAIAPPLPAPNKARRHHEETSACQVAGFNLEMTLK